MHYTIRRGCAVMMYLLHGKEPKGTYYGPIVARANSWNYVRMVRGTHVTKKREHRIALHRNEMIEAEVVVRARRGRNCNCNSWIVAERKNTDILRVGKLEYIIAFSFDQSLCRNNHTPARTERKQIRKQHRSECGRTEADQVCWSKWCITNGPYIFRNDQLRG